MRYGTEREEQERVAQAERPRTLAPERGEADTDVPMEAPPPAPVARASTADAAARASAEGERSRTLAPERRQEDTDVALPEPPPRA